MASEPVVFDKNKWDTTRGLDWGNPRQFWPKPYKHHDFEPLFKNIKLISQYDMEGRGDSFQINKKGDYLFINHLWSSGWSVVDVHDAKHPKVVFFEDTGSPHVWSQKNRIFGDILVTSQEWKYFEPKKYFVNPDVSNYHFSVSKEVVKPGIKIWDISKPATPRLISFYQTNEWAPEGDCCECHRFWFDGHYVYISASKKGFEGKIMLIIDVSNPEKPREVSKFWLKGQWFEGGETPDWPKILDHSCACHHPIVRKNRAYATWFGLGATIIDISDVRIPKQICHINYDMGGQTHTFLPIRDGQYAVLIGEYRHGWILDLSDEQYPRVISMLPKPPNELLERGVGNPWGPGPHNIHENLPGPDSYRSDDMIFCASGAGGIRVFDIHDPYRPTEVGYYVPGTPKVYYDPRGVNHAGNGAGIDVTDLWVDPNGLIYLTSYNGALEIIEWEGTK